MTAEETVIAEIARTGSRNVFRVTVSIYKGVPMIYFKDWYPSGDGYKPCAGGTGIPLRRLPEVFEAMARLLKEQAA